MKTAHFPSMGKDGYCAHVSSRCHEAGFTGTFHLQCAHILHCRDSLLPRRVEVAR
jgi:hypothetical protein